MKTKKLITNCLLAFVLIFSMFIPCFAVPSVATFAETGVNDKYSNVLDDLQKDENFDAENFIDKADDYSINVIQVAEGVDRELFVYTYEPSRKTKKLRATTIRISQSIGINFDSSDYSLTELNSNGTLVKYKVEDITLKEDVLRYYSIPTLHREFDEKIDDESDNNNTTNEVACEVAQLWTAVTNEGQVTYACEKTMIVKILNPYASFVRYLNGFLFIANYTDSHYIAFDAEVYDSEGTVVTMDDLVEAKVTYQTQEYTEHYLAGKLTSISKRNPSGMLEKSCPKEETVNNTKIGLWGKEHEWNRIQTTEEFMSQNDSLKDEEIKQLSKTKYVIRFLETEFNKSPLLNGYQSINGIVVSDVSILQLTFVKDKKTYTLGAVDNKYTGTTDPGNEPENPISDFLNSFKDLWSGFISVLLIIAGVILIAIGIWAFSKIVSIFKKGG